MQKLINVEKTRTVMRQVPREVPGEIITPAGLDADGNVVTPAEVGPPTIVLDDVEEIETYSEPTMVDMTTDEIAAFDAERNPPLTAAQLNAHAAAKRWRVETGGLIVGGLPVPTDDRAKLLLMGAAMTMTDTDTAPFVTAAGAVTLTGAQFKGLYSAIIAHVQACFATQQQIAIAIATGTITTAEQIDTANWPS